MTDEEKRLVNMMIEDGYIDFFNKYERFYYDYGKEVINFPDSEYLEINQDTKTVKKLYYKDILDLLYNIDKWGSLETEDKKCIRIFNQYDDTLEIIFYIYEYVLEYTDDIKSILFKNIKKYELEKL